MLKKHKCSSKKRKAYWQKILDVGLKINWKRPRMQQLLQRKEQYARGQFQGLLEKLESYKWVYYRFALREKKKPIWQDCTWSCGLDGSRQVTNTQVTTLLYMNSSAYIHPPSNFCLPIEFSQRNPVKLKWKGKTKWNQFVGDVTAHTCLWVQLRWGQC